MYNELERRARYEAYRWFRLNDLEASHADAWAFALAHWPHFRAHTALPHPLAASPEGRFLPVEIN